MPCHRLFIAADGAVYAARSATLPGKFQQMMAHPVEGMAAIRVIDQCFSLSGAENSHQHHHRPGRLGDARRTRCSAFLCQVTGLCA